MPYRNAGGHIFPHDVDAMDLMFLAVEKYPELHIVTCLNKTGKYMTLNRYEPTNACCYYLYTGNADPEIEFTDETSMEDWTDEEIAAREKAFKEFRESKYSPTQIAAVNFAIHAARKCEE